MNRQRTAVTMAAIMAFSAAAPMTAEASSSYSMRKKVITAAGIMTAESDDSRLVTRAQFAEMLVKASTYRSSVSSENNVSIFSDVDRNSEYASYIRVAVEQGWMTGYLGGKFKPDENITMQEAVKAVLPFLDIQMKILEATRRQTGWLRRPIWNWTRRLGKPELKSSAALIV